MSKGKLIVLEGLDGSGKATQAKLLAEHLAAQGVPVQKLNHLKLFLWTVKKLFWKKKL